MNNAFTSKLPALKLSFKLPLLITLFCLLSAGIVGYIAERIAEESVYHEEEVKLMAITDLRARELSAYLESIQQDMHFLSSNPTTIQAQRGFSSSWSLLNSPEQRLQDLYINNNPFPTGQKENLDYAKDGSDYSRAHKQFHPWFREFLRDRGYYDIFIFDTKGNLIYTVFKELDYATNFKNGKYRDTDLGKAYRDALKTGHGKDEQIFYDFKPYAPSHGAAASFIATPIIDDGRTIGVLAFQMPIDRINGIMQSNAGLGQTGETYIIGNDLLVRNDSRHSDESIILKRKVEQPHVKEALDNKSGALRHALNHENVPVLTAYTSLEFLGTNWAIIGEITDGEVEQPIVSLRNNILLQVLIVALCVVVLSVFIARRITSRINRLATTLQKMSNDEVVDVPSLNDQDELGDIARAVDLINQKGTDAARIQIALNSVRSCVMMADENNDIIFMNPALETMLRERESQIQEELSNFKVDELIGGSIDRFHKNPEHQKGMLKNLTGSYETSITVAGAIFDLVASAVTDSQGNRIGTVVEWQDVTELREKEAREVRIQTSLDNVTSNVMLADETNTIIYINPAVQKMLAAAQNDIRKELPNFDANTLVGTHIDTFHKNPEHQRSMLEGLQGSYETSITVGGRIFDLIASSVEDKEGNRLGTVVEWKDVTLEKSIEEDVQRVVDGCIAGDFTQRLTIEDKEGFMLNLAKGINEIGEVSNQGLSEVVTVLNALSEGKLTDKIAGEYQGLFKEIKDATNATINQLHQMVGKIKESAQSVNNASNEISSGSADLSQRTEQQASTLEETAASMEELTGTVRQNDENATQANKLAGSSASVATKGGEVVERAVTAMSRIEDSSKKISDIISVIDEIAFQTNLLALNAAVEAARAGDAGKGFAVVASEVRTLAGRSAEASKDIKKLIQESSEEVTSGSELVNEAGETLKEIVTSVQEVAKLISEIADASNEQTSAIEEINTAVAQMDEGTQQNAALVQENTAAAQSMVEQSEDLENLVSFFVLDEGTEEETASIGGPNVTAIEDASKKKAAQQSASTEEDEPAPKPAAKKKAVGSEYEEGWEEF